MQEHLTYKAADAMLEAVMKKVGTDDFDSIKEAVDKLLKGEPLAEG